MAVWLCGCIQLTFYLLDSFLYIPSILIQSYNKPSSFLRPNGVRICPCGTVRTGEGIGAGVV